MMNLLTRWRGGRAALLALATLAATVLATPAAVAAPTSLTHACTFPSIGKSPLATDIVIDVPDTLTGDVFPASQVSAFMRFPDAEVLGESVRSLRSGELILGLTVAAPGLSPQQLTLRMAFENASVRQGSRTLLGRGELPSFGPFPQSGTATFTVDSVALNAELYAPGGSLLRPPPLGEDSDGNPDTTDIPCDLDPAEQDAALQRAAITVDPAAAPVFAHQCPWPLVDTVPMSFELKTDAPAAITAPGGWVPWSFDVAATFYPSSLQALQLFRLTSVSGQAVVNLTLEVDDGTKTSFLVATSRFNVSLPSADSGEGFTLTGTGAVPAKAIGVASGSNFKVTFDHVTIRFDGQEEGGRFPDFQWFGDDAPANHWSSCTLDPAGQDLVVARGSVLSGPALVKPTVSASNVGFDAATVNWTSADGAGAADGYEVVVTGPSGAEQVLELGPTASSAVLSSLEPDREYTVVVRATDAETRTQVSSDPVSFTLLPDERVVTPPGKPVVTAPTSTGATVCWAPSEDPRDEVVAYEVFVDGTKVQTVTGGCTTLTGLQSNVTYSVAVRAVLSGGAVTAFSPATAFKTAGPPPVKYGYGVSGAAQLKNLTRGTVPLSGSVDAELTLATGDFTADLSLQRSTANLVALGFLPVVAKVDVVPTTAVTGNLAGGVLEASTKVRIKLPQVTLFGLQLAGGSNCQTRSASAINLRSVGVFDALDGGTLAGTFSISDLTGCGVLTGLVSPLTSGPGNTIALKLAPATA